MSDQPNINNLPLCIDPEFNRAFETQLRKLVMRHQLGLSLKDRVIATRLCAGRFWRAERLRRRLTRREVAQRMGEEAHYQLVFLENGMLDPADIEPVFISNLAEALGDPQLEYSYRAVFEDVEALWSDHDLDPSTESQRQEDVETVELLLASGRSRFLWD